MTFLQFTTKLRGYYVSINGKIIHKYELYFNNIDPDKIVLGLTNYKLIKRVKK